MSTVILGINAYHGDASACVVIDGELKAAVEEERFRRIKHWAGFPKYAIEYCLSDVNCNLEDVDYIAINRKPNANLHKKALFAFSKKPSLNLIKERLANVSKVKDVLQELSEAFAIPAEKMKAKMCNIEHHRAHLGSSFYVSPYDKAALVSVDGFGDFVSTMWGYGEGQTIFVRDQIYFPHSLGMFYLALTQYLGFDKYGDEYKVMGLSPYGKPSEMDKMREIVQLEANGKFQLNLDYFNHHSVGVVNIWDNSEPKIGQVFSSNLEELLGPKRSSSEPLTDYHKNIAASVQTMYEEAFFSILNHVQKETEASKLCLAGGCAMNSVANGKILERTNYDGFYIQPAAGDAGGAIGAAYSVWHEQLKKPRQFIMNHAYWGPEYSEDVYHQLIVDQKTSLESEDCQVTLYDKEEELCAAVAKFISEGEVIGWFQGRMEWGARALGNRSILADPRRADMKDILNLKIKRRESFRPFAPSILREETNKWFETDYDVPFMLKVFQIKEDKRCEIPAVTHVNGSGRLQTVTKESNARYYQLIKSFYDLSDVPMLLNTSFNENEPVVCKPKEAMDCFLRTKMDVLVLGNYVIRRQNNT
ncbi:carbamoyltransferase family protein [Legionella impletisoli]|uniref:Carbamoyltransferase n=1 Tax=Legionella impletisoli TaxID=343510 RepID=A0A917NAL6_9GAMM|nr:carbamoyltransferase C-terminal domain-containing protein [Legionella impletisoli]GGI81979.1 hypothetical protein GCM10007966_08170 [Legionella impletisoli]